MQKFHIHLWLVPKMNIHRNPLCGRNYEYFSKDAILSDLCAYYEMKGVQSFPGLGVTLKNFFCNNQEDNRFFVIKHVNERALLWIASMLETIFKGQVVCKMKKISLKVLKKVM